MKKLLIVLLLGSAYLHTRTYLWINLVAVNYMVSLEMDQKCLRSISEVNTIMLNKKLPKSWLESAEKDSIEHCTASIEQWELYEQSHTDYLKLSKLGL